MLSVGGDPEFFLVKDDVPVSAHDILPGTKEEPYKLKHGAVQVDGMAGEMNIKPSQSAEEFEYNVDALIKEIRTLVPKGLAIRFHPTAVFLGDVLDSVPRIHKELGCSPDWNAYSGLQNDNPTLALEKYPNMRSAGGHIAIGWGTGFDKNSQSHIWDCEQFIKTMDQQFGAFADLWDEDKLRANLYGKPGAYRPTTFGVEYRTPSNAWVRYPKVYPFIFNLVQDTFKIMMDEDTGELVFDGAWLETVRND